MRYLIYSERSRTTRRLLLCIAFIVLVIVVVSSRMKVMREVKYDPITPPVVQSTNSPLHTNLTIVGPFKASDLTPDQREALDYKFRTKFAPVLNKWAGVYSNHMSFDQSRLTADKFVERIGDTAMFYLYTYVFDGNTFSFQESNDTVKVSYLASKESVGQLNRISTTGSMPTLKLPIAQPEVIKLVKDDTGTQFGINQVFISPTGAASSLNGGAYVNIAPPQNNPAYGPCKMSMVFDEASKMVYYLRDVSL